MIAIDPGAAGGIVAGSSKLNLGPTACGMPGTDRDIAEKLFPPKDWGWDEKVAYLEDLVKFAGRNMPSSSMATYASNWGLIKGILTAYDYRIVIVPPKKWQKALGLGGSDAHATRSGWKNHLKQRAQQLFPQVKVTLSTADALLIYEAARQGHLG
jgi:hypothetical protein